MITSLSLSIGDINLTDKYCDIYYPENKQKSTLEYNYITTEEWINNSLDKYQDILP